MGFFAVSAQAATRSDLHEQSVEGLGAVYARATNGVGTPSLSNERHAELLGLDAESALNTLAVVKDSDGTAHYRYQQTFRGVPVWGEHVVASDDKSGSLRSLFGRSVGGLAGDISTTTTLISTNNAFVRAKGSSSATRSGSIQTSNESSEKMIYVDDNDIAHLVYVVSFFADRGIGLLAADRKASSDPTRPYVIIDTQTGGALKQWDGLTTSLIGTGPGGNSKTGQHNWGSGGQYGHLDVSQGGSTCTIKNTDVKSVNLNGSTGGPLTNGVTVTGIGTSTGNSVNYTLVVPAGSSGLNFVMSGGTGDADMYVKFGSAPTDTSYDCRPYASGNSESCPIATAQAGTYYVRLKAYSTFAGVSLTGSYSAASNVPPSAGFSFTTSALTANFSDSFSDSDGTIASRSWNFGDSSSSTSTNPSHTYAAAGTYNVTLTVTDNNGATSSTTKAVSVTSGGGGGGNVLQNGVAVTGLAAATGGQLVCVMAVPAGATGLKFVTSGGGGDGDLYVRFGSAPTTSGYDCRSWASGNTETCNISTAQAGTCYVMINAYSAISGMSLTGSYSSGGGGGSCTPSGTVLCAGSTVNSLSASKNNWTSVYSLVVPAGASNLSISIAGGSGDADLHVRLGSAPTTSSYTCRPYKSGNSETCTFSAPTAGTYYISVRAYATFSGVSLSTNFTQ